MLKDGQAAVFGWVCTIVSIVNVISRNNKAIADIVYSQAFDLW